jgi:hypothetical protein
LLDFIIEEEIQIFYEKKTVYKQSESEQCLGGLRKEQALSY